jgi:nucleoside-diphosphate-sugar epimerase
VIHAATETAADFHRDKLNVFEQILAGTRNSMAFAAAHGVRRVLLTGSGAQYGAIPAEFAAGVPESSPNACDPSRPSSAYGEAKRASEMLAALYGQKHGIDIINTRCFAFVGPGLPLEAHFAIGNFIGDALRGTPIQLATSGDALRSYLYGADLAVWLLCCLLIEADNGSVVNVGSGHAISILELAGRVRDVVSPRLPVRPGETVSGLRAELLCPVRGSRQGAWSRRVDRFGSCDSAHRVVASDPCSRLGSLRCGREAHFNRDALFQ